MSMPAISWKLSPESRSGDNRQLSAPAATRRRNDPDALMVCIVDNDAAIRDSLSFLIESERIPVATFASSQEFLDTWNSQKTGCLLVDIRMPGMSGLELQAELARQGATVPMIIITGFGDVQMAVQAMKRGAFDFFEKPIHHQLLLDRLHQALSQETAARKEARQKPEFQKRFASLSPTQREVLTLVVQGKTSPEIKDALGCAQKTIEVHRTNIYNKMGCRNLATIVRMVLLQRVIDEESE